MDLRKRREGFIASRVFGGFSFVTLDYEGAKYMCMFLSTLPPPQDIYITYTHFSSPSTPHYIPSAKSAQSPPSPLSPPLSPPSSSSS